jgi:hypothetical protein
MHGLGLGLNGHLDLGKAYYTIYFVAHHQLSEYNLATLLPEQPSGTIFREPESLSISQSRWFMMPSGGEGRVRTHALGFCSPWECFA